MSKRVTIALACAAILSACTDPVDPANRHVVAPQASAVVFAYPEQSPGAPFYAISGNGGFIPTDGSWAAVVFHRNLSCVPASANLLALAIPFAFGCTLMVSGHEHWENGPGIDPAPRQTTARGLGAVPIVFARWSEVQGAVSDNVLTLPELLALPSAIVGSATTYNETDIFGISGPLGAGRGMYKISARGTLPGNGTFRLMVNEVLGEQKVVQIELN
jgi:hypothetical protein